MLGPEHEYSLVDQELKPLPISDTIIKSYRGKIINFIELPSFTFGKELQLHVMEVKANHPFRTPIAFEETMQNAVSTLTAIVGKHGASLLGTGMHPLLQLKDTGIWPHYHKNIYNQYGRIFNLRQHGWLNIQSFHLNLPFQKEEDAIQIHNYLANLVAYLPAITASSPIYEGKESIDSDNRLHFYKLNQKEVPLISGDIIPEYVCSFEEYRRKIIDRYSADLAKAGADKTLLSREWVNSRGVIFRFDRSALEIRIMDEQECIKSDVALACFIRSVVRGLIAINVEFLPHDMLVSDFNSIVKHGLEAEVSNPNGRTAKEVCEFYLKIAEKYASDDEKKYLWLIRKRIDCGNLSDLIRQRVRSRAQKTTLQEAIIDIYSTLINCLKDNEPYF